MLPAMGHNSSMALIPTNYFRLGSYSSRGSNSSRGPKYNKYGIFILLLAKKCLKNNFLEEKYIFLKTYFTSFRKLFMCWFQTCWDTLYFCLQQHSRNVRKDNEVGSAATSGFLRCSFSLSSTRRALFQSYLLMKLLFFCALFSPWKLFFLWIHIQKMKSFLQG